MSKQTKAVFRFIGAYIALHIVLYICFLFFDAALEEIVLGRSGLTNLVVFFVLQEIILLGLISYIWKWMTGQKWKQQIELLQERRQRKGRRYVWTYVCGGLALYFMGSGILLSVLTRGGREIPGLYGEQMVMQLLSGITLSFRWEYVLIIVLVAVIGPFVEEVIFRGVMTHSFMQDWGGKGVVLASLVFAITHTERAVVRNLVILSLFLGYIYWKTESMWYSFLFHLGINGLAVMLLVLTQLYPELAEPAFMWLG